MRSHQSSSFRSSSNSRSSSSVNCPGACWRTAESTSTPVSSPSGFGDNRSRRYSSAVFVLFCDLRSPSPPTFQRLIVPSRLALMMYGSGEVNHALRSVTSCQWPSISFRCSILSSRSEVSHDLMMSPEAVNRYVPSNEGTYKGSSAFTPAGCWIGLIGRFFSLLCSLDGQGWIFAVSSAEASKTVRGHEDSALSLDMMYLSRCSHCGGPVG